MRFSPPLNRAVTPEDVRASLIRALSPQLGPSAPAADILHDVVGLSAYRYGRTNGIAGIAIRHGKLQITTTRAGNSTTTTVPASSSAHASAAAPVGRTFLDSTYPPTSG
jgi:hypothetical protein